MDKQDRQGVRTPADLERKYNLGRLATAQGSSAIQTEQIERLSQELAQFIAETNGKFQALDRNTETFFYSGVPTLENAPAVNWNTNDAKSEHIGDLYYNADDGSLYLFKGDGTEFEWVQCSSGSEVIVEQEKIVEITENGATEILPDEEKTLSKVTVNVDVQGDVGVEYTSVVYNDDNTITLTDTDGYKHTMECGYTDEQITTVKFDGISVPLQYNEGNLVKVGGVSVDVANAPVSASGGGTEELEQLIDESGVVDTEGTVTEKVEQLIDLAEKGKNDTLKARLTNTLTEYTIMDAITLTAHCFNGCSNLVKFSAPNLVKSANNSVFYGCSSLEYVDFGRITMLNISDVNGCHRITAIILRNTETVVSLLSPFTNNNSITREDYVFGGISYYCYFYVPKALLEDYKVATNWSNYANRFRAIEDYPEITGGVI